MRTGDFARSVFGMLIGAVVGCSESTASDPVGVVDDGSSEPPDSGTSQPVVNDDVDATVPAPEPDAMAPEGGPADPIDAGGPSPTPTSLPNCDPSRMGACDGRAAGFVGCVDERPLHCVFAADGCVVEAPSLDESLCEMPVDGEVECGDGRDNDDDDRVDCADSDCVGAPECDPNVCLDCSDPRCVEIVMCAEICGDDVDNDRDSLIDCEDDDCADLCGTCEVNGDLGYEMGKAVTTGSTLGATSNHVSECGEGAHGGDLLFTWTAPSTDCFTLDTLGSSYDTVLHVHRACPEFPEQACSDDVGTTLQSQISRGFLANEQVWIVVDGDVDQFPEPGEGEFQLNINFCAERCADGEDDDLDGLTDCADADCVQDAACVAGGCEPSEGSCPDAG